MRTVTVIVGIVVALTFCFGFGNVLALGLRLGVPVWVAPLVAPAVDLSVVALLLGTRHLALHGGPVEVLRPARRLLTFALVILSFAIDQGCDLGVRVEDDVVDANTRDRFLLFSTVRSLWESFLGCSGVVGCLRVRWVVFAGHRGHGRVGGVAAGCRRPAPGSAAGLLPAG